MAAPAKEEIRDAKGASRMSLGGWLGLVAAFLTIAFPIVILEVSAYHPGGFFTFASSTIEASGLLVIVGAVLYVVSLMMYRWSFSTLRKYNPQFWSATILCLIGSIGFLLIIVSVAVVAGNTSSLLTCVHGQPSHAISCLESGEPFGAYTVLVGFACAWIGGIGVVVGLSLAGELFRRMTIRLGAAIYLLFLLAALIPLVDEVIAVPSVQYLVVILPLLAIAAPVFVLLGARPAAHELKQAAA
jgi:hypothetical protein